MAAIIITADYFTKWLIRTHMHPGESIPLIPHVFHITYIRNPGAAFGLLPHRQGLFLLVTVLVVIGILYADRAWRNQGWVSKAALGMIAGGAIGNLIDRLRWGEVVDFLDFRIWPVFNVADSAVVAGGILLALWMFLSDRPAKEDSQRGKA